MRNLISAAFAIALAALPVGAVAQTNGHGRGDGHGHPHHGGQTQHIGPYEVELVVKGAEVTLFVLDSKDQKVDAATLTGAAEVLAKGNERKRLELKPAGDNKLAAKADFVVEGKFRATVTLRNAQGSEIGKARYNVDVTR